MQVRFAYGQTGLEVDVPAVASIAGVLANHGVQMVGHPQATWGVREGNPIWEEMMEAAARVVHLGGAIVLAVECRDGVPEYGEFARLLRSADGPRALLDRIQAPGFLCHDQMEAQVRAIVQLRAEVHV